MWYKAIGPVTCASVVRLQAVWMLVSASHPLSNMSLLGVREPGNPGHRDGSG